MYAYARRADALLVRRFRFIFLSFFICLLCTVEPVLLLFVGCLAQTHTDHTHANMSRILQVVLHAESPPRTIEVHSDLLRGFPTLAHMILGNHDLRDITTPEWNHVVSQIQEPLPVYAQAFMTETVFRLLMRFVEKASAWSSDEKTAFFDSMARPVLFQVIHAANFMDMQPLLDASAAYMADAIRAKTPEQIRTLLQIPNTFTAEEEAQIEQENRWIEEML